MFRSTLFPVALCLAFGCFATGQADERVIEVTVKRKPTPAAQPLFDGDRPAVDVAILLDTSNSMDGLISQAKTQLWTIVQQFSEAKKNGQTPSLRVALFEYGNSRLPATEGYIRQVVQLTDDLDVVSEKLFALTTNGGDEYCGQVIKEAVKRLDWSSEPGSYKAIFIAGNEPFTQGTLAFQKACKKAVRNDIIVNTIHCGTYAKGVQGQWEEGAKLGNGKYLNINQDAKIAHIECPQDKVIIKLNAELNKTYLWFGDAKVRRRYAQNQVAQDENAAKLSSSVLLGRTVVKSGKAYNNSRRDLVDALESDVKAIEKIENEQLPADLQKLSKPEQVAHIKKISAERKKLQEKIAQLNQERAVFLAEKRKEAAATETNTLGDAVIQAVQSQLKTSGFEVK